MSSPRFGGMAAILAGLLLALWLVTTALNYDLFLAFVPAAVILLVLSFPAMHSIQRGQHGAAGRFGYGLLMVAGTVLVLMFLYALVVELVMGRSIEGESPWLDAIFPIVFFVFLGSLVLFGIASAVAGVLPRLAVLGFMLALPVGLALDVVTGAMDRDEEGIGFYVGIGLLTISLLWLGSFLWSRATVPAASRPDTV